MLGKRRSHPTGEPSTTQQEGIGGGGGYSVRRPVGSGLAATSTGGARAVAWKGKETGWGADWWGSCYSAERRGVNGIQTNSN
jgi:hypothetical protein